MQIEAKEIRRILIRLRLDPKAQLWGTVWGLSNGDSHLHSEPMPPSSSLIPALLALMVSLSVLSTGARGDAVPSNLGLEKRYGRERLVALAQDPQWKRILHYNRFFPWSGSSGEVDGEGFYQSPRGREDPFAELEATLFALEGNVKVGKLQQPAICAFPERLRYLKKNLGLSVAAPVKGTCTFYEQFIAKMNPQGVTLVFSSAFASNPGSMFGHTFLKINTGRKSDLLDKGISFAATVPPGEGGLLYVVLGLMGGYAGEYSFSAYNEKVQEYVDSESRDLWEYSLDFTPEESQRLVDHLWELVSNSWFDYYFINKNCSYQLLTAIEVIKPEWDLSSGWLWVVPAETVKRVIRIPGAVTQIRYRPSLRKRMLQGQELLTSQESRDFKSLVDRKLAPADVASPNVLTTAIQYVQYHRAESEGVNREDLLELWDKILERRSQLPISSHIEEYQAPPPGHPEQGHGPIMMGLAQGLARRSGNESQLFEEFRLKPAYHDLMNNDLGYPRNSEINFPNLTFRFYPQITTFVLEQLQFVGMTSIFPLGSLEKRWSWKVDAGIEAPKDLACGGCHVAHAEMGWGASVNLLSESQVAYLLGGAYFELGSGLERPGRLGPAIEAGLLFNPWQSYKLRLRSKTYADAFQPYRPPVFGTVGLDQSLAFSAHWEVRLEARQVFTLGAQELSPPAFYDGKLSVQYYF